MDLSRADSFEVLVRNKQSRIDEIVGVEYFSECSRVLGRIQYADGDNDFMTLVRQSNWSARKGPGAQSRKPKRETDGAKDRCGSCEVVWVGNCSAARILNGLCPQQEVGARKETLCARSRACHWRYECQVARNEDRCRCKAFLACML